MIELDIPTKLPIEIWLKIFRMLSQPQIFLSIALVNKYFWGLTKDPSLLKKIVVVDIEEWHFKAFKTLLERTTMLKEINLMRIDSEYVNQLICKAIKGSVVLSSITISKVIGMAKLSTETLKLLANLGKNLHYLDISGIQLESNEIQILAKMTQLKTLKIGLCGYNDCDLQSAKICNTKELVIVIHTSRRGKGRICLTHYESQLTSLKMSYVDKYYSGTQFSFMPKDLIRLIKDLDFEMLSNIEMTFCPLVTNSVLECFLEKPTKSLEYLSIEHCWNMYITNLTIYNFCETFPNLKVLDLSKNRLGFTLDLSPDFLCLFEDHFKIRIKVEPLKKWQIDKRRQLCSSFMIKTNRNYRLRTS